MIIYFCICCLSESEVGSYCIHIYIKLALRNLSSMCTGKELLKMFPLFATNCGFFLGCLSELSVCKLNKNCDPK